MQGKILVAGGERQVVSVAEMNLRTAGYYIICASNGAQTLDLAQNERPDVIVIDTVMPDISGIDVIRRLQVRPETSSIPIVAIFGKPAEKAQVDAIKPPVRGCLTKPLDPKQLVSMVDDITRPPMAPMAPRRM